MNNLRALVHFKNVKEFNEFYNQHSIKKWLITNESAADRADKYSSTSYFIKLKELYNEKIESIVSEDQIISWIDSFLLLKRTFDELNNEINDIHIISEYSLPFTKNKRPDYLLVFKNTIIILEFSYMKQNYYRIDNFNKKYNQLLQYESLIKNLTNNNIKTITYFVDYEAEYEENEDEPIVDSIEYNSKNIKELAKLIKQFYKQDEIAIDQILKTREL